MRKYLIWLVAMLLCGAVACAGAQEGAWKTVYVKRGFVGNYDAGWAGGVGATLRMRVPMPCDATRVRVFLRGCYDAETELAKMALVKGVDNLGKITGPCYPVLFAGQPTLKLAKGLKEAVSDPLDVPVRAGIWYLEDMYASQKYPYAYDVDREFAQVGDHFDQETLPRPITCRVGTVTRIDVFTTDTRPTVLCYGDSITHGYASTPNAGHRYPDILATLLNRPTLNMGVNGDVIIYAAGMPGMLRSLAGVDTVVFLMGINDIISNPKFTTDTYIQSAQRVIAGCKAQKVAFYIGTILPAGGDKAFDNDPAKEAMRQKINTWIRTKSGADGVIDFDAALTDPHNPTKLKVDFQSGDWLHPNDAGYQLMAETAARVLDPTRKK